jgi:hypothetical protein
VVARGGYRERGQGRSRGKENARLLPGMHWRWCSTWRRPVIVKSDCAHTQNLPPCNGRQALPYRPGAHCQPGNRGLQVRTYMARYSAQRGSARFPVVGDRRVRMKADGLPRGLWCLWEGHRQHVAALVRASRFDRERCVRHESKEKLPVHGRRGVERPPEPEAIIMNVRGTGARKLCPSCRSEGAMAPARAGWVPLVPQRPR